MVEIFKRNNINTIEPASQEEKDKWDRIVKANRWCFPYHPITHYYSTADIKNKWLEGIPFENIKNEILDD